MNQPSPEYLEERRLAAFLPRDLAELLPPLAEGEPPSDPLVPVKLFTPATSWTWLLLEYDPDKDVAFGFAHSAENHFAAELGYIDLGELRSVVNAFRTPLVERDIHWTPVTLSDAKESLQ